MYMRLLEGMAVVKKDLGYRLRFGTGEEAVDNHSHHYNNIRLHEPNNQLLIARHRAACKSMSTACPQHVKREDCSSSLWHHATLASANRLQYQRNPNEKDVQTFWRALGQPILRVDPYDAYFSFAQIVYLHPGYETRMLNRSSSMFSHHCSRVVGHRTFQY